VWNTCTRNTECGIYLVSSNGTVIHNNTLAKNNRGILLNATSWYNIVTFNWFVKNITIEIINNGTENIVEPNLFITKPIASFTPSATAIIRGNDITFTDTTMSGAAPLHYEWNFGDGTSNLTTQHVTHQFLTVGVFTVVLTVNDTDGDASVYSMQISVIKPPLVASFIVNATTIVAGGSVRFSDTSTGGNLPLAYRWDFGDGTFSTEQNPSHQYTTNGTYNVTLTVTDSDGDVKIYHLTITVEVPVVEPYNWLWIIIITLIITVITLLGTIAYLTVKKARTRRSRQFQATSASSPRMVTSIQTPALVPSRETILPAEIAVMPLVAEDEAKEVEPGVYSYRGGRIVGPRFIYKVKIKNATDTNITDVLVNLVSYPRECMTLATEETRRVGKIEPKGFRSLEFELTPTKDCVEGTLVSSVVYMDTKNEPQTMTVAPFTLKSVCDLMEPLTVTEREFDTLISSWAKTEETITFKEEDIRGIVADVPRILESKNFQTIIQHNQDAANGIRAEVKALAIGKYTKRKLALVVRVESAAAGSAASRGDGKVSCTGYAEDPSMLVACLSEVLEEFRKPLVRLIYKLLKGNKNAMDANQLRAMLKVEPHILADAIRQQDDLVLLRGGETVATYDFIADSVNNMRSDYTSVPMNELEAELRPVGKAMRFIIQDLINSGKLRAMWVGTEIIKFKAERHKLVLKILYSLVAFISGLVTILLFLLPFFNK